MKDLNTNLLRHHQREEVTADIEHYDEILKHAKPDDKPVLIKHREAAKKHLQAASPEPLTGAEKDKLNLLEKKLRDKITTNMPTEEVMRKNPSGALDWHQRWEKANKKLVRMWKNVRIQLNPDSSDRDLANIERYRPSGAMDRLRTDAQISGVMSYGNISEEQWPFEAPQNTALEQVKRHYNTDNAENDVNAAIERMDAADQAPVDAVGYGPSGKLTLEEYTELEERLRKAREVLAQNRANTKQVVETLEAASVSKID